MNDILSRAFTVFVRRSTQISHDSKGGGEQTTARPRPIVVYQKSKAQTMVAAPHAMPPMQAAFQRIGAAVSQLMASRNR